MRIFRVKGFFPSRRTRILHLHCLTTKSHQLKREKNFFSQNPSVLKKVRKNTASIQKHNARVA